MAHVHPTPPPQTVQPPWLARQSVGLFAMAVGLFALSLSWRRAGVYFWPELLPVSQALGLFATAIWSALLLMYCAKWWFYPKACVQEARHPLGSSLVALLPLSTLLCVLWHASAADGWALPLALLAIAAHAVLSWRIVGPLVTGERMQCAITPALYVPPVAGSLVGAMTLQHLGYSGWAAMLLGTGIVAWALLELRILNRLFDGPLPEAYRPTIGLEMAPASVSSLAAASIWPQLSATVLMLFVGICCGPVIAVLARWRWWTAVPFSPGFWSFSFPIAALAGLMVEAVHRGLWPQSVAAIALLAASTVIAGLFALTVRWFVKQL